MRLRTLIAGGLALAGATAAFADPPTPNPIQRPPIMLADVNNVISEVNTARIKTKDGKTDKAKTAPNAIPKKDIPTQDSTQKR